jgi:RimJ/RimL family protein N-acetyltransferase
VSEALVRREVWAERGPQVPPHRRIDPEGHPTVEELEESIRRERIGSVGLFAIERRAEGDVIGCCGLVSGQQGTHGEPELVFELLRRAWGHGYATEAATAVLEWARTCGHGRVWATVRDWNAPSRRVLAKVGFTETEHHEFDAVYGTTLFTMRRL